MARHPLAFRAQQLQPLWLTPLRGCHTSAADLRRTAGKLGCVKFTFIFSTLPKTYVFENPRNHRVLGSELLHSNKFLKSNNRQTKTNTKAKPNRTPHLFIFLWSSNIVRRRRAQVGPTETDDKQTKPDKLALRTAKSARRRSPGENCL